MNSFRRKITSLVLGIGTACSAMGQSVYDPYYFATLAGQAGSLGSANGAGATARFNSPQGIAKAANGIAYVADTGNNTIRRIDSQGAVSLVAGGAGISGNQDGIGAAARFSLPQGIVSDQTGVIYVADSGNNTIRKISSAGDVTTFAGSPGATGNADGTGNAARFNYPTGLALDGAGNLYVADNGNYTIRKITPAAVVTTAAGTSGTPGNSDGLAAQAQFGFLSGLAADSAGNIYVADTINHNIRRLSTAGLVTTVAGLAGFQGDTDGDGPAARFKTPRGVALDTVGNVYVADTGNGTIRRISASGTVRTLAGFSGSVGSTDGKGSIARFNFPYAIALEGSGKVAVADTANHTIRLGGTATGPLSLVISRGTEPVRVLTGEAPPGAIVTISAAPNLSNNFVILGTTTADARGIFRYEDAAAPIRFYRASLTE